jgi:glucose-1-phosphate thymidylyltransferase
VKGLLLAGGHGTRLRPLTYTGNKHMLPIANKPMILYGLEHLRNAGITEVAIILGPIKEGVVETLGNGSSYGMKITYIDQPEPKGLAHAVLISEEFMKGEPFVMYLGDNLLRQGVGEFVKRFKDKKLNCVIGVCPVPEPSRFGVAELDSDGKLVRLVEKPRQSKSNLALIGVYVFDSSIFDAARKIKPSWRNELEITDAIQMLLHQGKNVEVEHVSGWWKDTGLPEDLLEANQLVLSDMITSIQGSLSNETKVTGNLQFGSGSRTVGEVNIRGPVSIGSNCVIGPNVYVGPYTAIGDNTAIRDTEIENSIVMKGSRIETANKRIVDSLVGAYSSILDGEAIKPKGYRLVIGERSVAQI